MNLDKEIRAYLVEVKKDLVQQIDNQALIASGRMKNSLRVVANQRLVGELRGTLYTQYNEKGFNVKPKNVSRRFVDNIKEWMYYKGISPKRNGEILPATSTNIRRSAFAIAKGIIDNGTPVTQGLKGIDIEGAMKKHESAYLNNIGKEFFKSFDERLTIK